MTRKEAIYILKNTIVQFGRTNGKTAYAEALQMAIKTLEQPEIIHCQGCKYIRENQGEFWICTHPDNNAWRITKEFYCGRAERWENERDDSM